MKDATHVTGSLGSIGHLVEGIGVVHGLHLHRQRARQIHDDIPVVGIVRVGDTGEELVVLLLRNDMVVGLCDFGLCHHALAPTQHANDLCGCIGQVEEKSTAVGVVEGGLTIRVAAQSRAVLRGPGTRQGEPEDITQHALLDQIAQ